MWSEWCCVCVCACSLAVFFCWRGRGGGAGEEKPAPELCREQRRLFVINAFLKARVVVVVRATSSRRFAFRARARACTTRRFALRASPSVSPSQQRTRRRRRHNKRPTMIAAGGQRCWWVQVARLEGSDCRRSSSSWSFALRPSGRNFLRCRGRRPFFAIPPLACRSTKTLHAQQQHFTQLRHNTQRSKTHTHISDRSKTQRHHARRRRRLARARPAPPWRSPGCAPTSFPASRTSR